MVPLGSFQIFKVCSDAKVREATVSYHTYPILGKTAALISVFAVEHLHSVELQPRLLRLQ